VSESLLKYFHTDWSAMSRSDLFALVTVMLLAALMVGLYVWVFKPSNKDKLESYRNFVNQNDEMNGEIGHGHAK
jgi:cytochrome c oxidase cbb3-type subunit IV